MANVYVERGDQTTPGLVTVDNPLPVSIERSVDDTGRLLTTGTLKAVSAELTRPADTTAYAAGDAIATSTTAAISTILTFPGMARYVGGGGRILKVIASTSQKANVASYRLWLFTSAPTKVADNAVLPLLLAERVFVSNKLDIGPMETEASTSTVAHAFGVGLIDDFVTTDGNLYGILEPKTAFTPDSAQTFRVTLIVQQY